MRTPPEVRSNSLRVRAHARGDRPSTRRAEMADHSAGGTGSSSGPPRPPIALSPRIEPPKAADPHSHSPTRKGTSLPGLRESPPRLLPGRRGCAPARHLQRACAGGGVQSLGRAGSRDIEVGDRPRRVRTGQTRGRGPSRDGRRPGLAVQRCSLQPQSTFSSAPAPPPAVCSLRPRPALGVVSGLPPRPLPAT